MLSHSLIEGNVINVYEIILVQSIYDLTLN